MVFSIYWHSRLPSAFGISILFTTPFLKQEHSLNESINKYCSSSVLSTSTSSYWILSNVVLCSDVCCYMCSLLVKLALASSCQVTVKFSLDFISINKNVCTLLPTLFEVGSNRAYICSKTTSLYLTFHHVCSICHLTDLFHPIQVNYANELR